MREIKMECFYGARTKSLSSWFIWGCERRRWSPIRFPPDTIFSAAGDPQRNLIAPFAFCWLARDDSRCDHFGNWIWIDLNVSNNFVRSNATTNWSSFVPSYSWKPQELFRQFDTSFFFFFIFSFLPRKIMLILAHKTERMMGSLGPLRIGKQFHQLHRRFINNSWCTVPLFG